MTDPSSLAPHADPQQSSAAPLALVPPAQLNGALPPPQESIEDDDSSIIKCICGFTDDDGHTVFCERCNTWQHIHCYYPNQGVPDVHECADCLPRSLDREAATEHQRQLREVSNGVSKKAKRPTNKQRKKAQSVDVNGWTPDKGDAFHDRKSGSPKDHQPPAKKTKSGHKHSASVASLKQSGNRKRAASVAKPTQSPPIGSPDTPNGHRSDYFSPEYMRLCKKNDYIPIANNLFNGIHLCNDLSKWVKDGTACKEVARGRESKEIFQRLDRPIEELESTAPEIETIVEEAKAITIHGSHPSWHLLTVNQIVPANAFIGELKGHIGRKEDYFKDPSSRWSELRHPEPFVFFHSYLPIYIDARSEGNQFRYIRRSCRPNLRMVVFVNRESQCHFCFLATKELAAGEEITISWDLDEEILQLLSVVRKQDKAASQDLAQWATGVLGNFGGCACGTAQCLLAPFDRRNGHHLPESSTLVQQPPKPGKGGRKVKRANQRSPPGTGNALNSRAGSEALTRGDPDDDHDDSPSVSGSTRSKPGSRDLTPMTHLSTDMGVGLGVDLSDRERRKLLQFQKYEDEPPSSKRRKRNSAGSTLNTPNTGSSKQPGPLSSRGNRLVKVVRPAYVDATVQTETAPTPNPVAMSLRRAPRCSRVQRLLAKRSRPLPDTSEQASRAEDKMDVDGPPHSPKPASVASDMPPPATIPDKRPSSSSTDAEQDVEMQDAPDPTAEVDPSEKPPPPSETPSSSHSSTQPLVPPWNGSSSSEAPNPSPGKPSNLHTQLPPTPTVSTPAPGTDATPTDVTTPGSIAPSPSVTTPSGSGVALMSPSVSGMAAPSPVKKKLSLSQYTSRKAKRNEALAAAADKEKGASGTGEGKDGTNLTSHPSSLSKPPEATKDGSTGLLSEASHEGDQKSEAEPVQVDSTGIGS